ncbi:MAG TPA: PQQ-binding-like beta-propeller repeat protein [Solirubrobacteraceae bacterium]|nr:PQQ-binding-like beta-propeller repeat protein [Solirubrobacteraceae bacterium]
MNRRPLQATAFAIGLAVLCACGGSPSIAENTSTRSSPAVVPAATTVSGELTDWPEFGLDPQRGDATDRPTGITAANVGKLTDRRISLPGTVDSSPIYLHDVRVRRRSHDVVVVTTSYGRTIAIDAGTGRLLWTFTPPGYATWAGTPQITNASPVADPGRRFVYAASPDGLVHKLSIADGREDPTGAWPARVTRDPTHEKLGSALNIDGPDVIATTSGYLGDVPTYQGHVALVGRATGRVARVFNTLCSDRHTLIDPPTCDQSDSAILSRGGAVVEPGGRRLLIDTGNASWNGTTDFGDSVLELTVPGLTLRQAYTPTDQAMLNADDLDLGSSAPALLGQDRILVAGKDAIMRVLDLARLDGRAPPAAETLGGELQTFPTPAGAELFTQPAVWTHTSRTSVFVADFSATTAYRLAGGRLQPLWSNTTPGTSPVVAGGLLYVYDPRAGGIDVYTPGSARPIAKLAGTSGHWNSPIVVDGHVVEPEGNANDHLATGTLDLFSVG